MIHSMGYKIWEIFHTQNTNVWRDWIPLSYTPCRVEKICRDPFIRMISDEEETYCMINAIIWVEKLKKIKTDLIKGYSTMSKAFSMTNLIIIFYFLVWLRLTWTIIYWAIMILYEALLHFNKGAGLGLIILGSRGWILLAIILERTL